MCRDDLQTSELKRTLATLLSPNTFKKRVAKATTITKLLRILLTTSSDSVSSVLDLGIGERDRIDQPSVSFGMLPAVEDREEGKETD